MPGDPPELQFDEDVATDVGEEDRVDGRFRVVREIARGGMSVVYLAEQEAVGRHVALKILQPPPQTDGAAWNFLERFRDEARRLASFQHPNVVTLYDFGETEGGRVFLAMEFVDGPRITDLLRKGPMDTVRAVRILEQIAKALRYTHQRGVIHRDISPANILISADADGREQPKLIDFGISAEAGGTTEDDDVIVGSPSCMSPEQIRGEELDERVDVYALGVVAYRMIVGKYPFKGTNVTETLRKHLEAPVPSLKKAVAARGGGRHIPDTLDGLVGSCLAKERSDRPADMAEVLRWLSALREEIDPDRTRTLHIEQLPERPTRWWLVALLALAAAALGAGVALNASPTAGEGDQGLSRAPADPAGDVGTDDGTEADGGEIEAQASGQEEGSVEAEATRSDPAPDPQEDPSAEALPTPERAEAPPPAPRPERRPSRRPSKPAPPKPAPEPAKGEQAESPSEDLDVPSGYKGMPEF